MSAGLPILFFDNENWLMGGRKVFGKRHVSLKRLMPFPTGLANPGMHFFLTFSFGEGIIK
jgi:hypothetical protein